MITSLLHAKDRNRMDVEFAELIFAIEEEFSIVLPEEEWATIRTVGDLFNRILDQLGTGDACMSSRVFYRLRRAMMQCLELPREMVRPKSKLSILLPESTRIAAWRSLEEVSYLRFPKLRHPRWARDTIRALTAIAALAFLAGMIEWTHPSGTLWIPLFAATGFVGFFALKALYALTGFLGKEFPVRTVGELAQTLLMENFAKFGPGSEGNPPPSRQEVWQQLVYIVSDQMYLNPAQVTPEARIVADLGID